MPETAAGRALGRASGRAGRPRLPCASLPAPLISRLFGRGVTRPGSKPTRMKTFSAKSETVRRDWYLVDAEGQTLGRLATELARRLRGKHKPVYTPHVDTGDFIVVINAEKIRVTGRKLKDKMYHRHTGYIGNMRSEPLEKLLARAPERVIEIAVKGMLPRNPLGRQMFKKLKVVRGPNHPHQAQQPARLEL